MTATRSLRAELSRNEPLFGAWLQMPNPIAAEAAGHAGFDWVGIDTQHGLIGYDMLLNMLQAVAVSGTPAIVRVSANSLPEIGRALDSGAQGVIIPLIETAEHARQAVHACRYPPTGGRSWGPLRPRLAEPAYSPASGDELSVCIAMVETEVGVENIDEIVAVEGIDLIYVGPSDLAASAGLSPALTVQSGHHQDLIERVAAACRQAGRWSGIHPASADVAWYHQQGYRLFPVYLDLLAFNEGARSSLAEARSSLT